MFSFNVASCSSLTGDGPIHEAMYTKNNVTAQRISFSCYHLHKESPAVYRKKVDPMPYLP